MSGGCARAHGFREALLFDGSPMLQTAREIVPASTKTRKLVSNPQKVDSGRREKKDFSKLNERGGNVYENKGSVFHSLEKSGNLLRKPLEMCCRRTGFSGMTSGSSESPFQIDTGTGLRVS